MSGYSKKSQEELNAIAVGAEGPPSSVRVIPPTTDCTRVMGINKAGCAEGVANLAEFGPNLMGRVQIPMGWISATIYNVPTHYSYVAETTKSRVCLKASHTVNRCFFDVFLSYNSKDRTVVQALAQRLRDDGIRAWLDDWELVPGRPWQDALEEMIVQTRTAAVLVGPSGLGPWEIPEMWACLSEFVSRGMPVIPVLLPGAVGQPALPLLLRQFTWVDMRHGITDQCVARLKWGITGEKTCD